MPLLDWPDGKRRVEPIFRSHAVLRLWKSVGFMILAFLTPKFIPIQSASQTKDLAHRLGGDGMMVDLGGVLGEWLNLLLRWAHIIIGIGWIGASFYFVWLDLSFRPRAKMNPGVSGTSWMVHGGGFYHVEKYTVAPSSLPEDLHWFKWEAYLTWVTGFALLVVQYYWNARAYLIDPSVMALEPWQAIAVSLGGLVAGWVIYDGLCRSPIGRNGPLLALLVFALIIAAAFGFSAVFSGRGALIHIGAFIGTLMAANVFMVIIRKQRVATLALMAGRTPDPALGATAKQRSVHNNYLTLPVLLMMVSSHYPLLTSHPHKWLVVALIVVVGAGVRHAINRHDAGEKGMPVTGPLAAAAVALLAAIVVTAVRPGAGNAVLVSESEALTIVQTHCIACHAEKPTNEAFEAPPAGLRFETRDQIAAQKDRIMVQAVIGNAMPLGNETGMTTQERAKLGAWLKTVE